ncbi:GD25211 [Drosophila simulans]|uniref:GD25211 n=1 Tax=Drosophila simulans TaxID=7240 RepID=B4QG09_DROSI|nr:GD25211 [Drosophila simulans]
MDASKQSSPKRERNPFIKANIISKWLFLWMHSVFRKGRREELDASKLYEHLPSFDSESLTRNLQPHWEKESKKKNPSLMRLIFKVYGWQFVPVCVLYSLLEMAIHSFQPLLLGGLISYFAYGQTTVTKESAYLYAMGIVLCSLVTSLVFHPFMFYVFAVGTRVRLACAGLVYRKCLRASASSGEGLGGQAISVMSIDLSQFDLTFYFFHDLWKGPVEACIFGYLMFRQVGWTSLIGIAFIVILIPLQAWAAKASASFGTQSAKHRDARVKLMNEIIGAIQVIKMYAWEKSFGRLIAAVRQSEVKAIRGSMSIYAALQCTNMISKISLFLSLVAYVYVGDLVTAKKVFILSSYYGLLNDSLLHYWPMAITTWAQTLDVITHHAALDLEAIEADKQQVKRVLSQVDRTSKQLSKGEEEDPATVQDENGNAEQQLQGAVSYDTYKAYFRALGAPFLVCLVLSMFVLARGCQALMDIFISRWATWEEDRGYDSMDDYEATRTKMVIWYTVLLLLTLALFLLRTFGFFFMCLRISLTLHDQLYHGIIRAWMYFFNANPSGRVLNRFSSDIQNVDVNLPQAMMDSLQFLVDVVAVLVIVAIANYWLLIPAAIMVILLYFCRALYIGASRSLKRIESLTRSPIYSHTNQTFHGHSTIRSMDAMPQLEQTFHGHQNTNSSALFLYVSANRAFSFWTDLICVVYILAVTFSFLVINQSFYSGDVGLAITQSMTLVIMCQWGMRQTAEMENNMTSVERVLEYAQTPSEPPLESPKSVNLAAEWPQAGHLRFQDLRMRYSPGDEDILRGLNFESQPMEKIGIVGRTGAGKSSIIQALFRLALNEGTIEIDGLDIGKLGLHDLRSRISIIPQDPVLFSGTLRFNLDPFDEKSDESLWSALEDVKLKKHVSSLEGGLSCRMQDGGSNFSMGQRQLVCLARAILRQNRVLVMDEATANVDTETDILIQETIQTKFAECTVLTIAHRLHTVMDNDSVLVMDAGQIVEFGAPHKLLQRKDGALLKLVNQNDAATVKFLKKIASESYMRRNRRDSLTISEE